MIPINLAKDINSFYGKHFPLVRPIDIYGNLNHGVSRKLSLIDAFILLKYSDKISEEAVEFVSFVSKMLQTFHKVESYFNSITQVESDHKDAIARPGGWAGHGCLPIALALYSNNKNGVEGDYVECGVFRGGSLACISHVCQYLGIKAYAADTFAGLPNDDETGYWKRGQFLGRIEEVKEAIEAVGAASAVEYIVGLFDETLYKINGSVSAVFLDTDLYDSSMSALITLNDRFSNETVIFSDGVCGKRDFSNGSFLPTQNEAKAIKDYFENEGSGFEAKWTGNGNMSLFRFGVDKFKPRVSFNTSFSLYLAKCFYFNPRFVEHIYVRDRSDDEGLSKAKFVTETTLLEYCSTELIQENFALNYFVGHLEWVMNQNA